MDPSGERSADRHADGSVASPLGGLLTGAPRVAAAGLALFADDLAAQGLAVERVDWRPPPAGTEAGLADVALDARRTAANA